MKRFLVILITITSLALIFWSCSGVEQKETLYESGQIKEQYFVKQDKQGNYLRDGYYKKWYRTGQIEAEGEYKNGSIIEAAVGSTGIPKGGRVGKWIFWYENGNK